MSELYGLNQVDTDQNTFDCDGGVWWELFRECCNDKDPNNQGIGSSGT